MKAKKHIIKCLSIKETSLDEEISIQNWINEQCSNSKLDVKSLELLIKKFTIEVLNDLILRFKDVKNWQIIEFVHCDLYKDEDDIEKSYVVERKKYREFDEIRKHFFNHVDNKYIFEVEYVWQTKGVFDNDYYGTILIPIYGTIYIKIGYSGTK
jgi:hypothetical protein